MEYGCEGLRAYLSPKLCLLTPFPLGLFPYMLCSVATVFFQAGDWSNDEGLEESSLAREELLRLMGMSSARGRLFAYDEVIFFRPDDTLARILRLYQGREKFTPFLFHATSPGLI